MNLSDEQLDLLKELINIGVGRGAKALNELLSTHVTLQVPLIRVFSREELEEKMPESAIERLATVSLGFGGGVSGVTILAFPHESAGKLVSIITENGLSGPDMDTLKEGVLTEIGNIIINGIMGSFSNILKLRLSFAIPYYREGLVKELLLGRNNKKEHIIIMAFTNFMVEEHLIEGNISILFEVNSLNAILAGCSSGLSLKE